MNKERNHFIDILKAIAIIFVIITHCNWSDKQRLILLFPFWVEMAVPIFMIVSGYVHSMSYEKKELLTINEMYDYRISIDRIIRYTIPFLIAYCIEGLYLILTRNFLLMNTSSIFLQVVMVQDHIIFLL